MPPVFTPPCPLPKYPLSRGACTPTLGNELPAAAAGSPRNPACASSTGAPSQLTASLPGKQVLLNTPGAVLPAWVCWRPSCSRQVPETPSGVRHRPEERKAHSWPAETMNAHRPSLLFTSDPWSPSVLQGSEEQIQGRVLAQSTPQPKPGLVAPRVTQRASLCPPFTSEAHQRASVSGLPPPPPSPKERAPHLGHRQSTKSPLKVTDA